MNPSRQPDWKSTVNDRRVYVIWRPDGAEVLYAFGNNEKTWHLRFGDDSSASPSMECRIAAKGPISRRRMSMPVAVDAISLDVGKWLQFGRSFVKESQHPEIITLDALEYEHCVLFCARNAGYCLVDLGNDTLVNQRPIHACLLRSGDLIQIGPFGFVLAIQTGRQAGFLLPVDSIDGVRLQLRDVKLDRLGPIDLCVEPGKMVAVVGPSGCGKSTLLKAITSLTGPLSGTITCDGKDIRRESAWYRSLLGYVSQRDVVPADVTTLEAVRFSAELRECQLSEPDVKGVLRQVDVPADRWDAKPSTPTISGGERKRVRIATELIAAPRLLIMDEPASGLDRNRESTLLRMLWTLRDRGCTIVVVTHNLQTLDWFDRACVIHEGQIAAVDTPAELQRRIPSGNLDDLYAWAGTLQYDGRDRGEKPIGERDISSSVDSGNPPSLLRPFHERNPARQFRTLWRRERAYLVNARLKRVVLPLLIVPIIFGASVGLAVQRSDRSLLGFLSLLACIWMGASNSLMAIVDEREVYEHERLLFLRNRSYVLSKAATYLLLSSLQTVAFVLALVACRWLTDREQLYHWGWACAILAVVGCSATGVGLFISALSKFSKSAATILLPLFMIAQIVFSVFVGDPGAARDKTDVHEVYQNYDWSPSKNAQRASNWARRASYLTLTRYGDRALRSFAYYGGESLASANVTRYSISVLLCMDGAILVLTWALLTIQNRWELMKRRVADFAAVRQRRLTMWLQAITVRCGAKIRRRAPTDSHHTRGSRRG